MPPAQGEKKTLVHNLSSLDLTTQEDKVLGYGLSFVPTPRYNAFKTRVDMFKLVRLLKLRSFFGERECAGTNALRSRSTFVPNISDHAIQTFEKVVLRDISQLEKQHSRSFYNLTQQERQLLSNQQRIRKWLLSRLTKGEGWCCLIRRTIRLKCTDSWEMNLFINSLGLIPPYAFITFSK